MTEEVVIQAANAFAMMDMKEIIVNKVSSFYGQEFDKCLLPNEHLTSP